MLFSTILSLVTFTAVVAAQQCSGEYGQCPERLCCSQYGWWYVSLLTLNAVCKFHYANQVILIVDPRIVTVVTAVNQTLVSATVRAVQRKAPITTIIKSHSVDITVDITMEMARSMETTTGRNQSMPINTMNTAIAQNLLVHRPLAIPDQELLKADFFCCA
jgi:hypothetical protein